MNPLTNVKSLQKINDRELQMGLTGHEKSWHSKYKNSAWIYFGGVSFDLTEGDLLCIFSQYGEIVNINLVRDKKTGKSRGFGFICYEDQRSTILAVDNFNGTKVCSRTIRVDHVENYKPPKDSEEYDELTRLLHEKGCAPEVVSTQIKQEENLLPSSDAEHEKEEKARRKELRKKKKQAKAAKKKLKKEKKKKLKALKQQIKEAKKDDSSSSSGSASRSSSSDSDSGRKPVKIESLDPSDVERSEKSHQVKRKGDDRRSPECSRNQSLRRSRSPLRRHRSRSPLSNPSYKSPVRHSAQSSRSSIWRNSPGRRYRSPNRRSQSPRDRHGSPRDEARSTNRSRDPRKR